MRNKLVIIAVLLGITTLTLRAYYRGRGDAAPAVSVAAVTRGTVVATVAASGTLQAVTTVQVGTQVSGSIDSLHADFNSLVHKGQVLARLDQSLYRSAIEQARANLARAQADEERLQVAAADAAVKLQRAQDLSARQLIAATELEAADVAVRSARAQVRSAAAQVTQARAALSQAEVNLAKTVITSPIDGIVIARNVDVGQTVASSLQAPTLFEIAADLRQMQLKANIDESDLGRIAAGLPVRFTVDAYPGETFTGAVEQVRLNPVVEQNVVTYAAIISAPNPELKLKPGMTASVTVEIARRDDVLRVSNAALRFRPDEDALAALEAAPPAASPKGADAATVWRSTADAVVAVAIRTGISDGAFTEVVEGAIEEGDQIVTRVTLDSASTPASRSASPLMPAAPGPRR